MTVGHMTALSQNLCAPTVKFYSAEAWLYGWITPRHI